MPRNYINVTLEYNGKSIQTKALIDTGNTTSEQCAMTKGLHNQLGAGFTSIGGRVVGTARPHHKIPELGVSKEIVMKLGGIRKKFSIKPMVVSIMTDEFNIARCLAKVAEEMPCKIEDSQGKTDLKMGQERVEMIRTMSGSSPDGEKVSSSGPNKGMDPGKGCQGQNARIETQPREGRGLDKCAKNK